MERSSVGWSDAWNKIKKRREWRKYWPGGPGGPGGPSMIPWIPWSPFNVVVMPLSPLSPLSPCENTEEKNGIKFFSWKTRTAHMNHHVVHRHTRIHTLKHATANTPPIIIEYEKCNNGTCFASNPLNELYFINKIIHCIKLIHGLNSIQKSLPWISFDFVQWSAQQ